MSAEESKALRERLQQQQASAAAAAANANPNTITPPPVGPQVLLTTSSPEGYAMAATPTSTTTPMTTTTTTATVESTTTALLATEEGGTASPRTGSAEMTHGAELSPLSFSTKETLSSESPSRSSSPTIDKDEDESQKKKKKKPTPVSSDILLPMIIFSVVKSNPPHLVSNLLYTQRFRNQSAFMQEGNGGESFCLINLVAVAEFLENVDLEGLGLGSAADTR